jgi:hypothetical protein
MLAQGQTGIALVQDGGQVPLRQSRQAELIVGDAHGRYAESVFRGQTFVAANNADVTLSVLSGTCTGLSLTNPAGSGRLLSILNVTGAVGTVALVAENSIALCANVNPVAAVVVHGTPATVRPALLGGSAVAVGLADTASTLPAAPVCIRHLVGWNWVTGGSGTNAVFFDDDVAGAVALTPGTAVSIQAVTAACHGLFSITWEELPFIS